MTTSNMLVPGSGDRIAASYAVSEGELCRIPKVFVGASDSPSIDAAGRWRTSHPGTIFTGKLIHADSQALMWDESLESGTMATSGPTANKPYIDFTSTANTAGKRTRQTFRHFNYQPGKSQQILIVGILELASGVKTGCERRIGAFTDSNGLFFESDAGVIGVTLRTSDSGSPVDTTVVQADWNLDKMNGDNDADNPSGLTLDPSKTQIFVMDFLWLSADRVRFGVKIGGKIHYVHEFNVGANVGQIPWASTPNLPLRYQMITTTSSGVCSMRCVCGTVISEGGTQDIGITRYKSTAGAAVTCTTDNTVYAILGIRLKTTHLGAEIRILKAELQVQTGSDSGEWILMFNPTVAGSFTYADLTNSAVQTAIGATTNTVTGGTEVTGGFLQSTSAGNGSGSVAGAIDSALLLGSRINGTQDTVVLCFRTNAATASPEVEGSLTWKEIS